MQATLGDVAGLQDLTPAERAIYLAVDEGDVGVREFQRQRGWSSPGTASNLLDRARRKVGRAE